jgi:hypothetical protein
MPRPPSEITGSSIQIAVRVTQSLKNEFKNLGGAVWLRKLLAQSINNRKNNETVPTPTANPQASDKRP